MRIQQSSQQGCVVLTLAGQLNLAAAPQLQRAILKHLAQQPPAIICDLGLVEGIDPRCAGVFTSIRHPALSWPGTTLLLAATQPVVAETLLQHGVTARLGMYPSLDQALQNAHTRPPWLLEGLQGELDLGEGALGAVDRDLYRLARGRGYIGALVTGYHFPWHQLRYKRYRGGDLTFLEEQY